MDRLAFWVIVVVVATSAVGAGLLANRLLFIDAVHEFDMYLEVADVTGVNVGTDAIYFGRIRPGDGVTKKIVVQSDDAREIVIRSSGDLEGWLSYETPVSVEPGEKKELLITVGIPADAPRGVYSGRLKVIAYK